MQALPKIDRRTSEQFAAEVRKLLGRSIPGGWPQNEDSQEAGEALIQLFGQMCGTVVDRLNKAPYKNFLAFLDMQGVVARPSLPARVPLTFHLAAQHTGHVKVPAHTQVAAKLGKDEKLPVIFETERELVVTSAELRFAGTKDASHDTFSDYSSYLLPTGLAGVPSASTKLHSSGVSMFTGAVAVEHLLYIDLNLVLPTMMLKEMRLKFRIVPAEQPAVSEWFAWEIKGERKAEPVMPSEDETKSLSKSGDVVFRNLPDCPVTTLPMSDTAGQWLICRLTQPLGKGPGLLSPASVPLLEGLEIGADFGRLGLPADAALYNQTTIDVTKEFFPFGERPRFGDVFYMACREAFSLSGAAVTVHFTLANPEQPGPDPRLQPVRTYGLKLTWEISDGKAWMVLGTSEPGRESTDDRSRFSDTTKAFTRSGTVSFLIPEGLTSSKVGGKDSVWIRVRIVAGDYGRDPHVEKPPELASPLAPPCVRSATVSYDLNTTSTQPAIFSYNDFQLERIDWRGEPVSIFRAMTEGGTWFYLGFLDKNGFSDRSMSVYVSIGIPEIGGAPIENSSNKLIPAWEYWNGSEWTRWTVLDGSEGFTRSGILRFLPPRDLVLKTEFGKTMCWFRVRPREKTAYKPILRQLVLNTTMAEHAITLPAEILGTSTGSAGQKFTTTRSPVLAGQQLEVREPTFPSKREAEVIAREEGTDAIHAAGPSEGTAGQVWVRWHEVPNFEASTEKDRHYIFDYSTGEVTFGDGVNGRVPPALKQNVRMALYRIGGGVVGNRPRQTVTELKTAIAYIDRVTNPEPAMGGAAAETYDALLRRAPRQIRHRWRAVTAQDYEDLAMLASPEVARVRCLATRDISKGAGPTGYRSGVVSLIIAPAAAEKERVSTELTPPPLPSLGLIDQVRTYLDKHRPPEVDLVIAGPDFLNIKVETEVAIVPEANASEVELAIATALVRFLHPITGNRDGNGWQFGEEPSRSDLFPVIEDVSGVDHVRELQMLRSESGPGVREQGLFLIFGTEPKVTATLEV